MAANLFNNAPVASNGSIFCIFPTVDDTVTRILTSPDGETVTPVGTDPRVYAGYQDAIWNGSHFVAFASNGVNSYIVSSVDGTNWNAYLNVTGSTLGNFGAAPIKTFFGFNTTSMIIMDDLGRVATTSDMTGATWTVQTSIPAVDSWYSTTISPTGHAIALGGSGYMSTSSDSGVTWSAPVLLSNNCAKQIAYQNNMFVAVGADGINMSNDDGATWTNYPFADGVDALGYNSTMPGGTGKLWFAFSFLHNYMLTSTDGITWTQTFEGSGGLTTFTRLPYNELIKTFCTTGNAGDTYYYTRLFKDNGAQPLKEYLYGPSAADGSWPTVNGVAQGVLLSGEIDHDNIGNTWEGEAALSSKTTGSNNTAVGAQSLALNKIGLNNTAIGAFALESNTDIGQILNFNAITSGGSYNPYMQIALSIGLPISTVVNSGEPTSNMPNRLCVSANGESVYVLNTNGTANSISVFNRDLIGELTWANDITIANTTMPSDIQISADGLNVYVTGRYNGVPGFVNKILNYSRNTGTGALTFLEEITGAELNEPQRIAITPDANYLYVTNSSNTIAQYMRSNLDGALTLNTNGPMQATGNTPNGIIATNTHVYVVNSADSTIGWYNIEIGGWLSVAQGVITTVASGPMELCVAPDGLAVYTLSPDSPTGLSTIRRFVRNITTGNLSTGTTAAVVSDTCYDIAISPDGANIYVTGSIAYQVYQFDALSFSGDQMIYIAAAPTDSSPIGVIVSPDGLNVYVANAISNSVSLFTRISMAVGHDYPNVSLKTITGIGTGASATIYVTDTGSVFSVSLQSAGIRYNAGDLLTIDADSIGGGAGGFQIQVQQISPGGQLNTAVGNNALGNNFIGTGNVAIGSYTLSQNVNGNGNTAIGTQSLYSNTNAGIIQNVGIVSGGVYDVPGVYTGVTLIGATPASPATANITIVGTSITNVVIVAGGLGYQIGDVLTINGVDVGGGTGFQLVVTAVDIGGSNNVAVGSSTLQSNTLGNNNTAVGYQALSANIVGYNNVAVGGYALGNNTTGDFNIAIGVTALQSNTTGSNNIAIGYYAGQYNTVSTDNVAIGNRALAYNSENNFNIAIGTGALSSISAVASGEGGIVHTRSIAIGHQALHVMASGGYYGSYESDNVAIGYHSMIANTNGRRNTVVGNMSMLANTNGQGNTIIGYNAFSAGLTGDGNIAIGSTALNSSAGTLNVAIGYGAGQFMASGSRNVIIGGYTGSLIADSNDNIVIANGSGTRRLFVTGTGEINLYGTKVLLNGAPAVLSAQVFSGETVIASTLTPSTGGITYPAANLYSAGPAGTHVWRIKANGIFTAANSATIRDAIITPYWGASALTGFTIPVELNVNVTSNWECEFILKGVSSSSIQVSGKFLDTYVGLNLIVPTTTAGLPDGFPADIDLMFSMSTVVAGDSLTVYEVTMERIA